MKDYKLNIIHNICISLLILSLATFTGLIFREWSFHETNIVVTYIFSVLLISRFTKGYLYGILASVVSLLLFNWFFTEPYFTLKVNDLTYLITFAIIMFASIMTSALTTKVKQSAEEAKMREKESNALYQMTNHLTDAENISEISEITVGSVGDVLDCSVALIIFDEKGEPERTFVQRKKDGDIIRRKLENADEIKKRIEQLHGEVDITGENYDYPIYGKNSVLAVLRIPSTVGETISKSQTRMLHSIIESASLALDRLKSLHAQAKSREETTQERYRANLLRAISHDIRTPLSGIMGTSEILMDKFHKDDPCYALAKDVYDDAQWLHGLVENILNLTRLQDGKLSLDKQPEAVEEVVGAAIMTIEKRTPGMVIDIKMPDNVLIVPMDAKLIRQVLINLLDNAIKHNKENPKISVVVEADNKNTYISVTDCGKGIAENDIPYIFQMFYTTSKKIPDSTKGVGLGLAICQSIIEAHGGSIKAENNLDGGAKFTFSLPMGGKTI